VFVTYPDIQLLKFSSRNNYCYVVVIVIFAVVNYDTVSRIRTQMALENHAYYFVTNATQEDSVKDHCSLVHKTLNSFMITVNVDHSYVWL
jgi:signal recognition particle receptor subunit beta